MYTHILVTGSIAYDDIMNFPGVFKDYIDTDKIHILNVSFVVDRLEKQIGGTGINITYNINKIINFQFFIDLISKKRKKNNLKLKLLSSIGKDGDVILQWMKVQGLDTSGILIDKERYTATGKVITDIKDNQIWGFYYGASQLSKNLKLKSEHVSIKNTLLIISATHSEGFLTIQKQAISLGIDYIYDPGMVLTWIKDKDLLTGVLSAKWLVGNDYEIARIFERIKINKKQAINRGISVITTLGENGVMYENKEETYFIPAVKLHKVVDPTGAGDAWRGGFIAGIASSLSVKESLCLGNTMASFAVEQFGTVNHQPQNKQFYDRLEYLINHS